MPTVRRTSLLVIPGFHLEPTASNGMMMIASDPSVPMQASRIMCGSESLRDLTGSVSLQLILIGKQMIVPGCFECTILHPRLCAPPDWNLEQAVQRIWTMKEANLFFIRAKFLVMKIFSRTWIISILNILNTSIVRSPGSMNRDLFLFWKPSEETPVFFGKSITTGHIPVLDTSNTFLRATRLIMLYSRRCTPIFLFLL